MSILKALMGASSSVYRKIALINIAGNIEIGTFDISIYSVPDITIITGLATVDFTSIKFSHDNSMIAATTRYGIYLYLVSDGSLIYSDVSLYLYPSALEVEVDFSADNTLLLYPVAVGADYVLNIKKLYIPTLTVTTSASSITSNSSAAAIKTLFALAETAVLFEYEPPLVYTGRVLTLPLDLTTSATFLSATATVDPVRASSFMVDRVNNLYYWLVPSTVTTGKVLIYDIALTLVATILDIYLIAGGGTIIPTTLDSRVPNIVGFVSSKGIWLFNSVTLKFAYKVDYIQGVQASLNTKEHILMSDAFLSTQEIYSGDFMVNKLALPNTSLGLTTISNY